jgi:hypothetical protein
MSLIGLIGLIGIILGLISFLSETAEEYGAEERDGSSSSDSSVSTSRSSSVSPSPSKTSNLGSNSNGNIDISAAKKRVKRASRQAESVIHECRSSGKWKEAAVESFLLADSLEKMYHSGQYFGDGVQLDSYKTALKAAEDARDNVIDLQNSRTVGVNTQNISPSQVEREYRRNMIASALMIAWCAGGLVGESRHKSARVIFHTSRSPSAVQSWDSFKELLETECGNYGTN